jgi:hypothetical protein
MLAAEHLIETARQATGLDNFGGDSFREGLEILVGDINADKERPPASVQNNAGMLTQALIGRLRVVNALSERPEVLDAPVERPVFVLGMPRCGTTLLSNLLASDPARRSPLKWELEDPVPPPTTDTLYTDPRALAAVEADRQLLAAYPAAAKYNPWRPLYPHECVLIMAHDFKTLLLESAGKLPNYRDWIFQTDVTSAYEYHKKWLQLHQADAPGIWNLKMPSHSLNIETLLKVYPDARLVWTHRDPFASTGSLCSVITGAHMGFAGRVDAEWIAGNYPWQAAQHGNRAMDARERIGHDRIIDVQYADMVRDPIGTMRTLYKALGDDFTIEAEQAAKDWLAENPQGKSGRHEYQLTQFGLSKEKIAPLFERYLASYDVEREG